MKLDLDFLESLLGAIEAHDRSSIDVLELISALDLARDNEAEVDKFFGHIKIATRAQLVTCNGKNFGIFPAVSGTLRPVKGTTFELNLEGFQLLEGLRNQTWRGRVAAYLKDVGVSGLKSAPAFVVNLAVEYFRSNGG